jgi:hypothetical protein
VSGWFLSTAGEPSSDAVRFLPLTTANSAGILYDKEAVSVDPDDGGAVVVTLRPGRYRVESGRIQFVIQVPPDTSAALLTQIVVR